MKIAVIGASSFLARHCIDTLGNEHEIIMYSRQKASWMLYKNSLDSTFLECIHPWKEFNLENDTISEFLEEWSGADVVLYCMAAGVQPKNQDSNIDIWQVNTFAPIELVEGLEANNFKGKLITFGSYFEIGNRNEEILLDEESFIINKSPQPNAYCLSKKTFSEYVANKHISSSLSFTHLHCILTNIYGVGENSNRLLPYIFDRVKRGQHLDFSSGIQKRQYTHIRDVAECIKVIISNQVKSGIFHLTDDSTYTVREVIETALNYLADKGFDISDVKFGEVTKRDSSMTFLGVSSKKAELLLNWNPKISLKQGISEYYESN